MKSFRDVAANNEIYIILFCVCLVLFLWPFWGTEIQEQIDGMFLYVFVVWAVAVAALFLATRSGRRKDGDSGDGGNR